ncbi:MAG: hypothetical protein IJP99_09580 [Methanobrevibacter sp.]|uniref:DUF4064 domain-containing protein n=1 Tax=Methanobrevibacter millerae TaxID=230361 RepID=A0A8T3VEE5_9EURY|nr:hypothetical protein [Methanobrevibacter millerae]MBE6505552.1 hypothetical protein [Methanobrevibacter millerae]MBR0059566.1 hypothetical protein [Methanobrevibacter sp.]
MKRIKTTSRVFEQILGVIGSFLSIISGSFILLIRSGGHEGNSFIALLAIAGAFLGLISSFYINRDVEYAGVGFVIAAILVLVGTTHGIAGALLLLAAGMAALFRK